MSKVKGRSLKVDIIDEDSNELISSHIIKRMNVAGSIRRYDMYEKIKEKKYSDNKFNQLVFCANLVCVLCDSDGNLRYPEPTDDTEDLAYLKVMEDLEEYEFFTLTNAYSEVNPIGKSLKAKKKRF